MKTLLFCRPEWKSIIMRVWIEIVTAIIVAGFMVACTVSFKNSLISSHSEEMEAFIDQAVLAFYDNDLDALVKMANGENGFTPEALKPFREFISETSQPANRRVLERLEETRNGQKMYVSLVGIPRDGGRETANVTVIKKDGDCCQLVGFYFNVKIGEQHIMETISADTESASEADEPSQDE